MDKVSQEVRSKIMRSVKSKDSKIEVSFRHLLWRKGLRYRKNSKDFLGIPDLVLISKKIVIFIDSCFWHGCEQHLRMPSANSKYWFAKIEKNKTRDKEVNNYYKSNKWTLIRLWEHELKLESQRELQANKTLKIVNENSAI